jgi:cytochrome b involved in lipid metabolism
LNYKKSNSDQQGAFPQISIKTFFMKKSFIISLFVFWAFATALLTAAFINNSKKGKTPDVPLLGQGVQNPGQGQIAKDKQGGIVLTADEVAKHNSAGDCWMIINGKIYDVTRAENVHPGGAGTILAHCGQDATAAFASKDKANPRDHSNQAYMLLADYNIGSVGQKISVPELTNIQQKIATSAVSNMRSGEFEIENKDD